MDDLEAAAARVQFLLDRHHWLHLAVQDRTAPNVERARQALEIVDRQLAKAFERWERLNEQDALAARRRELGIPVETAISLADLLPDALAELVGKILDEDE